MTVHRYKFAEGERFEVWRYTTPPSLEIVRKGDGANCYFQSGDDTAALETELENAELAKQDIARLGSNPVDYVCEAYETVLHWET